MRKDNTSEETVPALLTELLALMVAHRPAFRREQPYRRAVALVSARCLRLPATR